MGSRERTLGARARKTQRRPMYGPPTSHDLAEHLGVELTQRLKPVEVLRLRKALPGYVGLLDGVADQLGEDSAALNLGEVHPAELLSLQDEHRMLSHLESVAQEVHRSIYEQRLLVDDRAMELLQKISRRVNSRAEENPELLQRWKFLRDFLATYYPGRPRNGGDE
ncbi:MAG: hypothetical protein EXR72_11130 [Myxococcales bacterium]|nr:hypothetical protein [Myxococcales bacterium]